MATRVPTRKSGALKQNCWKNKDSEVVPTNGRGRPTKYRADYSARAEI